MIRKLTLVNVGLLALLAVLGWQVRREWVVAHAREEAFRRTRIEQKPGPPFTPLAKVDPLSAVSYAPMVQNNLFSKDRNPQVIIDPPAPPVEIPVPPFPVARGVMMWPGKPPTVVFSERPGADQRGYRAGDKVGPWTVKSLDSQFVVLEWNGKEFKKRLDELIDRSANMVAEVPAPAPVANNAAKTTTDLSSNPTAGKEGPGLDQGGGFKGCVAGDSTPNGAVVDGWKKFVTETPFGKSCHWEKAK